MQGKSRPITVTATASSGVAKRQFDIDTEDTITLTVLWENEGKCLSLCRDQKSSCSYHLPVLMLAGSDGSTGTGLYTSSWVAPKSDVHSQQRFFYMGQKGEINIDQAHRGYNMAADGIGYRSVNPLFMKYTPTDGYFSGQSGYGKFWGDVP